MQYSENIAHREIDFLEIKKSIKNEIDDKLKMKKSDFISQLVDEINKNKEVKWLDENEYTADIFGYIPISINTNFWRFPDKIWNTTLNFYFDIVPENVKMEMMIFMHRAKINTCKNHDTLVNVFKSIGENFKFMGNRWSENWRYYVDLQMCYRYYSKINWREILQDTIDWFNPEEKTWYTREQWLDAFTEGVESWFDKYWNWNNDMVKWDKFEDFIASGDWVTPGATDMHVPAFQDLDVAKTKSASFSVLNVSEKVKEIMKAEGQVNKVTLKGDEAPNKTRVIVSSDSNTYMLMAFISQWTSDEFLGDVSTVYRNIKEQYTFWKRFSASMKFKNICVPIDQKGFDHEVDLGMIKAMFNVYKQRLLFRTSNTDLIRILDVLEKQLFGGNSVWSMLIPEKEFDGLKDLIINNNLKYTIKKGYVKVVGKWNGGIASGWRWTIDWDTIANYAEFYAICKCLSVTSFGNVVFNVYQGDDLAPIFNEMETVINVLAGYKFCGLKVNINKFFISNIRHEFLRRVITINGVTGYPARSIHSLLYRAPTSANRKDVSPWSIMDLWLILARRECNIDIHDAIKDISGQFKLQFSDVKKWLYTPASVGGYGLLEGGVSDEWVKLENITSNENVIFKTNERLRVIDNYSKYNLSTLEQNRIIHSLLDWKGKNKMLWKSTVVGRPERMVNPYRIRMCGNAIWKKDIPNLLKPILVERLMYNKNMALANQVLEIDTVEIYATTYSVRSKQLMKTWLMEGLFASMPKFRYIGNEYVSGYYEEMNKVVTSVMSIHNAGMDTYEGAKLFLEIYMSKDKSLYRDLIFEGLKEPILLAQ